MDVGIRRQEFFQAAGKGLGHLVGSQEKSVDDSPSTSLEVEALRVLLLGETEAGSAEPDFPTIPGSTVTAQVNSRSEFS